MLFVFPSYAITPRTAAPPSENPGTVPVDRPLPCGYVPAIEESTTDRRGQEMRTTTATAVRLALFATTLAAVGCVERRFVIESNVPNARVYVDNKPIGAAPAYAPFEYYGYYNITIVHPGFETVQRRVHVPAPWYAYPPLDFIAEVLWPFHVEDVRRFYFEMNPVARVRTEDIINSADNLRQRGWALPSPTPATPNVLQEPVPPAANAPAQAPVAPPAAPPPASVVPSVTPSP